MTYWYSTPKQRSAWGSVSSKAKTIADIGKQLLKTKNTFPDSVTDGDLIVVSKANRQRELRPFGLYTYADGKVRKET